jgi:integrase
MRQGELIALHWEDVDLERATIAIRRSRTRDAEGNHIIGEPESAAGRRGIALAPSAVAALRRHRAQQRERMMQCRDVWQERGLVFDRGDGSMLTPEAIRGRFDRLIARHGLPRIRFHDTRHTAATLMMAEGIHPKVVSERLGHSKVSMTLDRYSHVTPAMQREAAERMERSLGA